MSISRWNVAAPPPCRSMMRYLGRHENVISLKDLVVSEREDAIYVFMSLCDSDLHKIIVSKQTLTEAHYKHFMFQLLRGLRFAHNNGIIHRDLKPANLLVTKDCRLRISDFGLSRLAPDETDAIMTEHVVTRWYRAPELMLSADGCYSAIIDVWSCGCILAELLLRKPLFPGKDFKEQLRLIFNVFGKPSMDVSKRRHLKQRRAAHPPACVSFDPCSALCTPRSALLSPASPQEFFIASRPAPACCWPATRRSWTT